MNRLSLTEQPPACKLSTDEAALVNAWNRGDLRKFPLSAPILHIDGLYGENAGEALDFIQRIRTKILPSERQLLHILEFYYLVQLHDVRFPWDGRAPETDNKRLHALAMELFDLEIVPYNAAFYATSRQASPHDTFVMQKLRQYILNYATIPVVAFNSVWGARPHIGNIIIDRKIAFDKEAPKANVTRTRERITKDLDSETVQCYRKMMLQNGLSGFDFDIVGVPDISGNGTPSTFIFTGAELVTEGKIDTRSRFSLSLNETTKLWKALFRLVEHGSIDVPAVDGVPVQVRKQMSTIRRILDISKRATLEHKNNSSRYSLKNLDGNEDQPPFRIILFFPHFHP